MTIPEWLYFIFKPSIVEKYGSYFVEGFIVTIQLTFISFFVGMVLGVLIALMRISNNKILNSVSGTYVYLFRSTPLIAQLFLFYHGFGSLSEFWQSVGLWWFFKSAWYSCLFIFTLNTAAYQAEIFRGSLQSIPAGQIEAANALGLSRKTTFFRVALPQAMIMALRPLGNELILMVKASAIASLVTIYDLMAVARLAYSTTYNFQVYIWAAILYLLIVEVLSHLIRYTEKILTRHLR